ncbi:MAG: C_GCAxxG_C_C family protein [Candidatus Heimdallarchaeota archaeon]|nr:C_GCAxxG_C_C family protein [Candidatus Heimdallarchaeota archaeon]
MSNIINEVSKYWNQESNCAQAVAGGVLEYYNMNECLDIVDNALLGFGGGMGERSICGAVTGGLAALGIIISKKNLEKEERSEVFKKFRELFEMEFDTLKCGEILEEFILPDGSVDFENPQRSMKCTRAVETAAKSVKRVIDEL